jgi:hypothetical protein
MITVNLWDSNFPDQPCSVFGQTSERVRYVRNQLAWDGISVFTDGQMFGDTVARVQSPVKVGWLHEGRALHPENYERAWDVRDDFDEIWTYDERLLEADPAKFKLTVRGGVWLPEEQWSIGEKTRHAAMILSEKEQLPGHILRHAVAGSLLPGLDLYGPAYTTIGTEKQQAYGPSAYAVVIEAVRENNFFSEHLLDALACGCVVFYWGCPNIGRYLNDRAIIPFETISELRNLLTFYGIAEYRRRLPAIALNMRLLPSFRVTEDWQAAYRYPAMRALLEQRRAVAA